VPDAVNSRPSSRQPQALPILASAGCFAAFHLGQGPAPVSLFVFALGLGYLYQSTHRILPCIVVHMALNAMTVSLLWLQSLAG
jgi:membrane protease YdiL (CAAX protease family)